MKNKMNRREQRLFNRCRQKELEIAAEVSFEMEMYRRLLETFGKMKTVSPTVFAELKELFKDEKV